MAAVVAVGLLPQQIKMVEMAVVVAVVAVKTLLVQTVALA
jgi:hypothetical protein